MRHFFSCVLICVLSSAISNADKTCSAPTYARPGHWAGINKECVALIQSKCPRVGLTQSWRRGTKVKENCNKIKKYTAIATFEGPNHTYDTPGYKRQHTAIFVSCNANGITVYHQYRTSGGVKNYVYKYGTGGNFDGNRYYTIL